MSSNAAEQPSSELEDRIRTRLRNHPLTGGQAAEYLFSPLGRSAFAADYWAQRPVYIKGQPDKFCGFFDANLLRCHLQQMVESTLPQSVVVKSSRDHGRTHEIVDPGSANRILHGGGTLCVEGLETVEPSLAVAAAAIKRDLGFCGKTDFRCYWSSDGHGFDMHFDARVATTLQIEGSKRWTFSEEVALPWPHYQVQAGMQSRELQDWEQYRPVGQCTLRDVLLEPGDVLCLPASTWHAAEARGESLALNLAFAFPRGLWARFYSLLGDMITTVPEWRQPPPLHREGELQNGLVSSEISDYFLIRLVELESLIRSFKDDPDAIDAARRRIISR